MKVKQPLSPIMDAFRDRTDDGIPRFIPPLFAGISQLELLHSGTGPSAEHISALTFAIRASTTITPTDLWNRVEPAFKSLLKSNGVVSTGSSAYCNDFCLEAEFPYRWGKRQGIATFIILHLDKNRIYLHGRACESADTRKFSS